jgi:hypothetical protein
MLSLHRAGLIELPAKKKSPPNNAALHRRPPCVPDRSWDPVKEPLSAIRPVEFRQVRRTDEETLFDGLIEAHHYLGYARPVGEHLKYLIYARGVPVACLAWSSAPRHLGCRDRFIGWSAQVRRRNLHLIAYNTRFLILPWVRVPHLASHILGQAARRLSGDWEALYGHPIWFLETFVDPGKFRGTCYRAANWHRLGVTTGRGKDAPTKKPTRPIKEVWGYPLSKDFRRRLGGR